MQIFVHHIYEYQKGLRRMVLHTAPTPQLKYVEQKMKKHGIPYIIDFVTADRFNVFFGDPDCIALLNSWDHLRMDQFTHEQDFILGALLGYDIKQQCQRYLKRIEEESAITVDETVGNQSGSLLKRGVREEALVAG